MSDPVAREVDQCVVKDLLGFEPRNSANWWVRIGEGEGSMLIAGCRIHYAQDVTSKPAGPHVYEVKDSRG